MKVTIMSALHHVLLSIPRVPRGAASLRPRLLCALLAAAALGGGTELVAQRSPSDPGPHPAYAGTPQNMPPGMRGTPNIHVLSHIPLGGFVRVTDIEIEQEESRPFAYVGKRWQPSGFDVISLEDPENAEIIYSWRIENAELHQGWGSSDGLYFKLK